MEVQKFIEDYVCAFGEKAELPLVFWYSDTPLTHTKKTGGCFFKEIREVRDGLPLTLNAENVGCGGGRFYTGFDKMPEHVPTFVSEKERYKDSPESVIKYLEKLSVQRAPKPYLNFTRIDNVDNFNDIEGLLFFATPDELSGLTTWAFFDSNEEDAVAAPFGSGCSSVVTQAVNENRKGGKRTFIGFFDPSVRPYIEYDRLSFVIPMTRFKEMYHTMRKSCLFDTLAWKKVRGRSL